MKKAIMLRSRWRRNSKLARLGARVGLAHAGTSARKVFASAERKEELSRARELKTAQQVATELGNMKGALMKLGQMASYLDDGLPEPMRMALAQLQSQAPPMAIELVHEVLLAELGKPVSELFVEFDDEPIAAASIGQVHRAILRTPEGDRAVAVKVQYPGVAEAIDADIRTADLLGTLLAFGFKSLNPEDMVAEIKDRLREELDYSLEAQNQQTFADFYRGHPFIHVPEVLHNYSTSRVLITELVSGSSFAEVLEWTQQERNDVGEAIFRFVFRSLYRFRAFNGDPHPGNYIFHKGGRVTFLDFDVLLDAAEHAEFGFHRKTLGVGLLDDALRDGDVLIEGIVRGIDHDGAEEARIDALVAGLLVAVVEMDGVDRLREHIARRADDGLEHALVGVLPRTLGKLDDERGLGLDTTLEQAHGLLGIIDVIRTDGVLAVGMFEELRGGDDHVRR